MSKEKYSADIDRVLKKLLVKDNDDLAKKNILNYTDDLEASGKIKKIAFDVFRVENDPYNSLWTVDEVDGKSYLIRSTDPQYNNQDRGSWTATSSYDKDNVTLAYKKIPIARFSSDQYGFSSNDIITFKLALLDSTADESFVKDVLMEQPQAKRDALASEFPEFNKIIRG